VLSLGSRRSSLSEFQAVGPATANSRHPYELRLSRHNEVMTPGRTKMLSADHIRLECSFLSSTRELYDEDSYAPSTIKHYFTLRTDGPDRRTDILLLTYYMNQIATFGFASSLWGKSSFEFKARICCNNCCLKFSASTQCGPCMYLLGDRGGPRTELAAGDP